MRRLGLAVAATLLASTALAADTAKMKSAQTELTTALKNVQRAIDDAPDQKDGGARLTAAKRELDEIEDALEDYTAAAKGDRTGEGLAAEWKADLATLEKHLPQLIAAKGSQYAQDGAANRCSAAEAALIRKVDDAVRARKVTQALIDDVNAEAEKLKPAVKRGVDDYEDLLENLERTAGALRGARAQDKLFEDAIEALGKSAEEIAELFEKEHAVVKTACKGLVEGKSNDKLRRALASAEATIKGGDALHDLLVRLNEDFEAQLKKARTWYDGAQDEVHDALCAVEEDPRNDELLADIVYRAADEQARELRGHVDSIHPRGERILHELEAKKTELATLSRDRQETLAKIAKTVDAKLASMHKEIADGIGQGANHPAIRTRIEIGKKKHKDLQGDTGFCNQAEVTIPGEGLRMDCVTRKGSTCVIIEIKPERNGKGKTDAIKEAGLYRNHVYDKWNKGAGRDLFAKNDKLKIFLGCEDPKTHELKIDIDAKTYDLCGDRKTFVLGDVTAF